jgi:hypothetical protein
MHRNPVDISRIETAQLNYELGEVLTSEREIHKRAEAIHKATYLGNLKHQKVLIQFNTGVEVYQVHTTIWLHYNNHIYLKGGIRVPIERILAVHF